MTESKDEVFQTLFPFLSEDDWQSFLPLLDGVTCKVGASLFKKDDEADSLFFLVEGQLGVKKETGFGDKTQVIALLDPGAPVGERGVMGGDFRHGATVIAVQDSFLYSLSKEKYEQLAKEQISLAHQLIAWLLGRVSLRLEKTSERLAHIL